MILYHQNQESKGEKWGGTAREVTCKQGRGGEGKGSERKEKESKRKRQNEMGQKRWES